MARTLYAQLAQRYDRSLSGFDRREFLKQTLAASAALFLGGAEVSAREPRHASGARRVIVVGGGFAGLACAYELRRAGCDVVVLESRNRVGGRVLSFHDLVPGKTVEGGGEYIGSNHPAWVGYSRRFGLELFEGSDEESESPLILNGRRLGEKEAKALHEEMEATHKQLIADARGINADAPWASPDARRFDELSTARWVQTRSISPLAKEGLHADFATLNGVRTKDQSYLGNLSQVKGGGLEKYWTESEVYRCRGGNQRLAFRLAQELGDRLRLNTPVSSIRITDHGALVTTASGELLEGDAVVLAVPPSTWRQIDFSPGLPWRLHPQMGTNIKFLAALRSRVWEHDKTGPDAMTDGLIGNTWHATDGQPGRGTALVAFSGADAAELCRRRYREAGDAPFVEELETIYPGFRAAYLKGRFMDWPSDRWTRAGYSFPAPGQVTTQGPILQRGLGRLQFAGEHTCYKFVGYMEGGLESGIAAARRVTAASFVA